IAAGSYSKIAGSTTFGWSSAIRTWAFAFRSTRITHMTLRQALDRTLLLMRDEVREDVGDDTLLPKGIDNICEAGSRGAGRVGRVRASLKPQNRPPRR